MRNKILLILVLVFSLFMFSSCDKPTNGKSAYEIAVENGFNGTKEEWLESLKGDKGDSGNTGSNGENGKSAYEIAVENGFNGTEEEWLESLKGQKGSSGLDGTTGKSAYEIYCEKYPNYNKSEEEWLDDLVNGRLANKEVLTVSFVVDDEIIDTKECYYGTPVEKPTNPTKEGYTFEGWYVDDEKWLFSVYPVYSNLELKAKFTENIYTVSINGTSKEYKYNDEITLEKVDNTESIVYEGYVDTKGNLYEFNSKYIVKSDEELTLKSHHKQIIFNVGDGQCNISSMEVTTGETTDELPIATKENYVFRGWLYNYKLYTDAFLYEFNDDIELVASFRSKDELFDYDTTANGIIINKYLGTDNSIVIPEKINGLNVIEIKNTLIDGNNKNIVSLTIPETVNTIEDGILEGQSKFETLICIDNIPTTIKKIFNVPTSSDLPTTFDTIKFSKITSFPKDLFTGNENKYNIVLLDGIKQIPSFTNATMIKSIIIPEGVTSIGYHAFEGCSSLTSITIPESVTSIKDNAFYGCSSLPSIVIPESVTSIGYYTFEGCSSLTSIKIPAGVTSIESSTFCGCSSLESIIIPAGVTSIGYYAFLGCSSLTSITIPAGVTSIENYVFQNCSSLTSITIPAGVTSIGYQSFSGCSSLTSITLPESVTSIGEEAFYKCSSLTKVYYKGTSPYTDTITSIAGYNEKLTSATWYYFTSNGANETNKGNWWYYDTDGVTIIEKVIE